MGRINGYLKIQDHIQNVDNWTSDEVFIGSRFNKKQQLMITFAYSFCSSKYMQPQKLSQIFKQQISQIDIEKLVLYILINKSYHIFVIVGKNVLKYACQSHEVPETEKQTLIHYNMYHYLYYMYRQHQDCKLILKQSATKMQEIV